MRKNGITPGTFDTKRHEWGGFFCLLTHGLHLMTILSEMKEGIYGIV